MVLITLAQSDRIPVSTGVIATIISTMPNVVWRS
jgi:hypothetical protein